MTIDLSFANVSVRLRCRKFSGEERLGHGFAFSAVIDAEAPIAVADVLGQPVTIKFETPHGERRVAGVVARWTAIGTTSAEPQSGYRALIRPKLCRLELRKRSRVYRKLDHPGIVQKLLEEGGYDATVIKRSLSGTHTPLDYVAQYEETDAVFLKRICEDGGLFLRFSCDDDAESVTIADSTPSEPTALPQALALIDDAALLNSTPCAHHPRVVRRRRPGKVVLNDYDPEHPEAKQQAPAEDKTASAPERDAVLYVAPGGYLDATSDGKARAKLALECARADARTVEVVTNVPQLGPGLPFSFDACIAGVAIPKGEHVVVAVKHNYRFDDDRHVFQVEAIDKKTPFRLPRLTPKPRISGIQSAITTGAAGQEIDTEGLGSVHARFHWDVEAPHDDTSSPPIRTMQPNMPDSMLLPRVGWEVLCAFENGDPDRPFVLGRSYTGKMMPPFSLPANKTVTSFATDSSPGAGGRNSIHFDDAAGREHIKIQATYDRTTDVADNLVTQTGNNERLSITGNHSETIGAEQTLGVGEALLTSVGGGLTTNVGAAQNVSVAGDFGARVGAEVVLVGGALVESAGNPVTGALNLAANAALAVVGSKGVVGAVAAAGLGIGKAAIQGYVAGGPEGARRAASGAATGVLAGLVPGGEAVMSTVTGSTQPNPWDHGLAAGGSAAAGGGAGAGASDSSAASGPGPGHRTITSSGIGLELVNNFVVVTPGQIAWTTAGAAALVTGGSKNIKTASATFRVAGASVDSLGSRDVIASGKINRKTLVRSAITATGALKMDAGALWDFDAPSVTFDIGGPLTIGDLVTFKCGACTIVASRSLVAVEAPRITVTGKFKQSGGMAHS